MAEHTIVVFNQTICMGMGYRNKRVANAHPLQVLVKFTLEFSAVVHTNHGMGPKPARNAFMEPTNHFPTRTVGQKLRFQPLAEYTDGHSKYSGHSTIRVF